MNQLLQNQLHLGQLANLTTDYWNEALSILLLEQDKANNHGELIAINRLQARLDGYLTGFLSEQDQYKQDLAYIGQLLNDQLLSLANGKLAQETYDFCRLELVQIILAELENLPKLLRQDQKNALKLAQLIDKSIAAGYKNKLLDDFEYQAARQQLMFHLRASPRLAELEAILNSPNLDADFPKLITAFNAAEQDLTDTAKLSINHELHQIKFAKQQAQFKELFISDYSKIQLLKKLTCGYKLDDQEQQTLTRARLAGQDQAVWQQAVINYQILRLWLALSEDQKQNLLSSKKTAYSQTLLDNISQNFSGNQLVIKHLTAIKSTAQKLTSYNKQDLLTMLADFENNCRQLIKTDGLAFLIDYGYIDSPPLTQLKDAAVQLAYRKRAITKLLQQKNIKAEKYHLLSPAELAQLIDIWNNADAKLALKLITTIAQKDWLSPLANQVQRHNAEISQALAIYSQLGSNALTKFCQGRQLLLTGKINLSKDNQLQLQQAIKQNLADKSGLAREQIIAGLYFLYASDQLTIISNDADKIKCLITINSTVNQQLFPNQ